MPFKLPGVPASKAGSGELADFLELEAWKSGATSQQEIADLLGRGEEYDQNIGCEDEDDRNLAFLDEALAEIDRRANACGGGYPFRLVREGTVLESVVGDEARAVLYRYLLMSTRLDMRTNRHHAGIDGALLLEAVAARVLRNYLGFKRSDAHIFGTSAASLPAEYDLDSEEGKVFVRKVNELCAAFGEGGGFEALDPAAKIVAKDGGLDVLAWIPFSDGLAGKLSIFAQCKTGTSWKNNLGSVRPEVFLRKWTKQRGFATEPVRAYCLAESADRSGWNGTAMTAGLLFDRCRLVDFGACMDDPLLDRMRTWTTAARAAAFPPP